MDLVVGAVLRHAAFYVDSETGALEAKYFVVLAAPPKDDIVFRLLTSGHADKRPKDPPCFHGYPYQGFYLGVLGQPLVQPTWLDLRRCDDLDRWEFARHEADGKIKQIMQLPGALLRQAMQCAAGSDDVTQRQERLIRDAMAALRV